MCPDSRILSVYFDGELPDPWLKRLETHLASCASCRERLAAWRRIRASALEDGDAAALEAARDRVYARLSAARPRASWRPALWRRSVSVPLPAAAAALLAIAILALALFRGGARDTRNIGEVEPLMAAGMSLDAQDIMPAADMNGVFQYLGNETGTDFLIIRLPENRQFTSIGQPALIKAAEYSGRNFP